MIALHQVGVRLGGQPVLQAVTAVLEAPMVGLIGANGAGKSTLLDVLSGMVPVQPGSRLLWEGQPLHRLTARQRALAGVRRTFQHDVLAAERSVADHVALPLDALRLARNAHAAALHHALQWAGLLDLREVPCGSLGLFDRRRVALARALAGGARLLLLDEPGAGLSAQERAALGTLLDRLPAGSGMQTLLVEHDLQLVVRGCSQLLALHHGRLLACGPTAQVLADARVRAACLGEAGLA